MPLWCGILTLIALKSENYANQRFFPITSCNLLFFLNMISIFHCHNISSPYYPFELMMKMIKFIYTQLKYQYNNSKYFKFSINCFTYLLCGSTD